MNVLKKIMPTLKNNRKMFLFFLCMILFLIILFGGSFWAYSLGSGWQHYTGEIFLKAYEVLQRDFEVEINKDEFLKKIMEIDKAVFLDVGYNFPCDRITLLIYNIKNDTEESIIIKNLKNELLTVPQWSSLRNDKIDIYIKIYPKPFNAYTESERTKQLSVKQGKNIYKDTESIIVKIEKGFIKITYPILSIIFRVIAFIC